MKLAVDSIAPIAFSRAARAVAVALTVVALTSGIVLAQAAVPITIISGATKGAIFSATGDFNKDGKADLAVTNIADNTVSVFIGNGDGTFQPQVSYATGAAPLGVTVADLNSDGKLDLAIANGGANTISILNGNGDGTFGPQVTYNVGNTAAPEPYSIAVYASGGTSSVLYVTNYAEGTVTILARVGLGYATTFTFAVGKNPVQTLIVTPGTSDPIHVATLNSFDGTVTETQFPGGLPEAVGTFNSGGGTSASTGAGTLPYAAVVGDFNADGIPDLAVANAGENNVSILLGTANGFQAPLSYLVGKGPTSVALLNVAGTLGLAVANSTDNTISVLLNQNGSLLLLGTVPAAPNVATPYFQLTAADFNGDGSIDLAATHFYGNQISILLGNKNF